MNIALSWNGLANVQTPIQIEEKEQQSDLPRFYSTTPIVDFQQVFTYRVICGWNGFLQVFF